MYYFASTVPPQSKLGVVTIQDRPISARKIHVHGKGVLTERAPQSEDTCQGEMSLVEQRQNTRGKKKDQTPMLSISDQTLNTYALARGAGAVQDN